MGALGQQLEILPACRRYRRFHTYAVNILCRWFILMPPLLLGKGILFEWMEADGPFPFLIFSVINFFPGVWFSARELNDSFAIHPRCGAMVLTGLLFAWFLEISPFLGGFFAIPLVLIMPLIFAGHFPLILLAWESQFHLSLYALIMFLVCMIFALFYRQKKKLK